MCYLFTKVYDNRYRLLSWSPVVIELLLFLWSYYVFVVALCIFTSDILLEKLILLPLYHLLSFLTMWSYFKAIFSEILMPTEEFHFGEAEWSTLTYNFHWRKQKESMENLRSRLGIWTTPALDGQGLPSYCYACKVVKPDRCHHCSRCMKCVLKMDHHCPWINTCVGFHNYKFFLLTVIYTFAYCLFLVGTTARFVYLFLLRIYLGQGVSDDHNLIQIVTMNIGAILFGLCIIPLFRLHCELVYKNTTTLEHYRPVGMVGKRPSVHAFDFGLKSNLEQVFGDSKLLWFFPLFTSLGDGAHFPLRGAAATVEVELVEEDASSQGTLSTVD